MTFFESHFPKVSLEITNRDASSWKGQLERTRSWKVLSGKVRIWKVSLKLEIAKRNWNDPIEVGKNRAKLESFF